MLSCINYALKKLKAPQQVTLFTWNLTLFFCYFIFSYLPTMASDIDFHPNK